MEKPAIEAKIRWSATLVVAGLVVQLLTMSWSHPLAFMAFLTIGCPLMFAGVLLFLFALATNTKN